MLSRVAESVFWVSRYVERAENVARFIDVNLNLTLDLGSTVGSQWAPLVYTTGDHQAFLDQYKDFTQEKVIEFLAFDQKNPNSILSCLRSARENARTVREMISSAMWEEINKFYLMVSAAAAERGLRHSLFDFFNQVKLSSHMLQGVTDATMSHGEAWHFNRIGRLLERADKTSRILDVKYFVLLPNVADVGTPLDSIQWAALLKSASALEMYRRRHGRITPPQVADFLMLDRKFPRAMHFCLIKAEESLLEITGSPTGTYRSPAEQHLGRLRAELDYAYIGEIVDHGLHEFIDRFQSKLNWVGEEISLTFFGDRPVTSRYGEDDSDRRAGGERRSSTMTQRQTATGGLRTANGQSPAADGQLQTSEPQPFNAQ
jgi:uncharacterized alpha-E superfamily protein